MFMIAQKTLKCKRTYRNRYRKLGPVRNWATEFKAGQDAFKRGRLPQPTWSKAKFQGWDLAGYTADIAAMYADADRLQRQPATFRLTDEQVREINAEPIGYEYSTAPYNW